MSLTDKKRELSYSQVEPASSGGSREVLSLQDFFKLTTDSPFVVFDTEFTAWAGSAERGWSQPDEYRELIHLGAVLVDLNKHNPCSAELDIIVKPVINPILSDYIRELTGIEQRTIERRGVSFKSAICMLHDFCGYGSYPLFSFGNDYAVLEENAGYYDINLPEFRAGFYDVRPLFDSLGIDTRQHNSSTIHQALNIDFRGNAHDALNDAYSVSLSLNKLVKSSNL